MGQGNYWDRRTWLGYLLNNQQQQLTKEIENTRQSVSESQLDVQKSQSESQLNLQTNQFAASLISSLLRGSERERLLALAALESVDKKQWQRFSEILAQHDSDAGVRLKAIEGLGKKGDGAARQTLVTIQEEGKTKADREEAKLAEASLAGKLKDNLKKARAFFDIGQWESAAKFFYEASKYAGESQVESSALAVAKSHYEHGGYREAASAFNSLFSKV